MLGLYNRSLMVRAMVPIAFLLVVITLAATSGVAYMAMATARTTLAERAQMMTTVAAGGAGEALWSMNPDSAGSVLAALAADPDYLGSAITDKDGRTFIAQGQTGALSDDTIVSTATLYRDAGTRAEPIGKIEVRLSALRSYQEIRSTTTAIAVISLLALLAVCGALIVIVRGVTRPIVHMTAVMTELAGGQTAVEVPAVERADEVGRMAKAVQTFRENAIAKRQLEADQVKMREEGERQRRAMLTSVAETFDLDVGQLLTQFFGTAEAMSQSVGDVAGSAGDNVAVSHEASGVADEVTANVQTVSAAVEELAVSIREISVQAQTAHSVSGNANERLAHTSEIMTRLVQDAARIGDVLTMISTIARQTNLLALNATIEAARAGDAGKGFAVVATEVKNLAGQTARATDEISGLIGAIQTSTGSAARQIEEFAQVVGSLSEISTSIAAAVEEQNSATSEISRAVQQAASGTEKLRQNVKTVAVSAQRNGQAASRLHGSIQTLQDNFHGLRAQVNHFVGRFTAA